MPVENLWWTVSAASTVALVTPLDDGSAEAFVVDACGAQVGERLAVAEGSDLYSRADTLFSTGLFAYDGLADLATGRVDELVVRTLDPVSGRVSSVANYEVVDDVRYPLGRDLNTNGLDPTIERFDDPAVARELDQSPLGALQRRDVIAQVVGSDRLAVVSGGGLAMVSATDLHDIWSLPSSNAFTEVALLDTVLLAVSDARLTALAVDDGSVLFSYSWADLGFEPLVLPWSDVKSLKYKWSGSAFDRE